MRSRLFLPPLSLTPTFTGACGNFSLPVHSALSRAVRKTFPGPLQHVLGTRC